MRVSELKISYEPKVRAADREKISASRDAYNILKPFYAGTMEHKECFFALYLNRANKVVGCMKLSEGGITETIIDQRILFEGALLAHSTAIILSHNHPSGQLFPSESDKAATNNIKAACKIMNFQLLDHIILTESGYYSFADEGLI
jgi:DNA repair protein RadC